MPSLTIEITGQVPLGGKKPGQAVIVRCDDDGIPLDIYWRRRVADEARSGAGHITLRAVDGVQSPPLPVVPVTDASDPAPSPAPRAASKSKAKE